MKQEGEKRQHQTSGTCLVVGGVVGEAAFVTELAASLLLEGPANLGGLLNLHGVGEIVRVAALITELAVVVVPEAEADLDILSARAGGGSLSVEELALVTVRALLALGEEVALQALGTGRARGTRGASFARLALGLGILNRQAGVVRESARVTVLAGAILVELEARISLLAAEGQRVGFSVEETAVGAPLAGAVVTVHEAIKVVGHL